MSMRVYIETYGCQMNKLDSENVCAILAADGFDVVEDMTTADVILFNTCGVREHAEQRIKGRITELHALRKHNPGVFFGIIGCMAQRLQDELLSDDVRLVAGPDMYRKLPSMIRLALNGVVVDTVLSADETYETVKPLRTSKVSAWIAITRGCNNYCSYCIVPYVRGRERSIPAVRIIDEIRCLRKGGWREVTLLGQNVNSYRDGDVDFAGLLRRVSDTGIDWIRFLTSHPKDLSADIIEVMAERDNICPHLHLPLQSGSDRILEAMNRRYTVSRYLDIIEMARGKIPRISITTDLIFGFPGETAEDFEATLKVMETVGFNFAFIYRYSERKGTKAYSMNNAVPEGIRIERLKKAVALQNSITYKNNKDYIGSDVTMLVNNPSKDGAGWFGFSETGIPVVFATDKRDVRAGSFVTVRIESTTGASLVGKAL